jgi:hypothetical protein
MSPDRDLLYNRPTGLPVPGISRLETIHEDAEGNVLSYDCAYGKGIAMRAGIGRPVDADIPFMPPLGPLGGILITIPTAGHNKFATDVCALSGWTMKIGTGTGNEAAGDTDLGTPITTYGGDTASVTPTVLNAVITWTHQWVFTTGASFAVSEAGVFKTALMMRHKYSSVKNVVVSDKLTCTLTDTM